MNPLARQAVVLRAGVCIRAIVILALCVPYTPTRASLRDRNLAELHHTGWSGQSGAPSGISSIAQTSDGMLWIGTEDGLFRFDGVRFSRIDEGTGIPYPSASVHSLYAPSSGGLWIGFAVPRAPIFLDHGRPAEHPSTVPGTVNGFVREADGTVWLACTHGLAKLDVGGSEFHRVDGYPSDMATAMFIDREGTLWVADEHAIYYRSQGSARFEKGFDEFGFVTAMAQGPDGRLWIADARGPVAALQIDDRGHASAPAKIELTSAGLTFDAKGSLWIGTLGNGLRRLRAPEDFREGNIADGDPSLETLTHDEGLTGNYVWPLLVGREGQIWIGTSGGLDRLQERALVPANFPAGSHDFALVAGTGGAVWAGTTNRPLMRLTGRELSVFDDVPPEITCAYRDEHGSVWFGGGSGIYRIVGEKAMKVAPYPAGAKGYQAQSIVVDRADRLWVSYAYEKSVYEWVNGSWRYADELPEKAARAQMLDRTGRIWRGYASNTIIITADGVTPDTIGAELGLDIGDVYILTLGGNSGVWVGGSDGLSFFDGDRFKRIAATRPSDLAGVSGIVELANGEVWVRSSAGLLRFDAASVQRALNGQRVEGELFNHLDGLPGQSAHVRPLPTLIAGDDGRLWQATASGVVWVDPSHLPRNPVKPTALIEAVTADGSTHATDEVVDLPPRTNRLQMTYSAASLIVPERVRFRYRLVGVDDAWQEAGARREAFYNNLSAGSYRFEVLAANDDGVWNEQAASVKFKIQPAFYETVWFRLGCILAGLLILASAYQWRLRHILQRVDTMHHERIVERERIARDLHDTLLQSVQGIILRFHATLLRMRESDPLRAEIEDTLLGANRVLQEGRDKVSGLRGTLDTSSNIEAALAELGRELAQQSASTIRITTEGEPRQLTPMASDEIYRIGAEALLNAVRHAGAEEVEVEIAFLARELRLRVRDNGRGIPTDVLVSGARSGHWGLPGMRERATRLGAKLTISSKTDVGTEIELRVPAFVAYGPRKESGLRKVLAKLGKPMWAKDLAP
jgi:signal transduction histidine kinase/streptogramin lyase